MRYLLPLAFLAVGVLQAGGSDLVQPFVTAEQLNMTQFLAAPPAAGTLAMKAETAELHRLQAARSDEEIARAQADDQQEDIFLFRSALGDKFNRDALPQTAVLSDHVHRNEGVIVNPAKKFFARARPYFADESIAPVCRKKSEASDYGYPSGHATSGYLEALVLAMMVPEKRDAILQRANEYAHNRLVCGVHYPADVEAGRSVAYAMIGLMLNSPEFIRELNSAKTETRQALGFR